MIGDKCDLKHYRCISLLSIICKFLSKIHTDCVIAKRQAGFNTCNNLLTVKVSWKRKMNIEPLLMAFTDFEMAFDTLGRKNFTYHRLRILNSLKDRLNG